MQSFEPRQDSPALDNLSDVIVLSREEKMPGILAPGIPQINKTDRKPEEVKSVTPKMEQQKCVTCQADVTVLMKFCPGCGTPLISVCKKCGAENQSGKFCSECGKAMNVKKRGRTAAHPT